MSGIAYGAAIIADSKLGMMVLLMGDLCDDINKCHGLVIVFEGVGMADAVFFGIELPGRIQILTKMYDIFLFEYEIICW